MSNLMASSTPKQAFSAAFTQLKPHRIKLFGVVLCGVLVAVAGLVGPWAVGGLVDKLRKSMLQLQTVAGKAG